MGENVIKCISRGVSFREEKEVVFYFEIIGIDELKNRKSLNIDEDKYLNI